MHGTLSCPVCGTTGIALGAAACPHCAVGFTSPVGPPGAPGAAAHPSALAPASTATAAAPAGTLAAAPPAPDQWAPTMYAAPGAAQDAPHPAAPAEDVAYASIWRRMGAGLIDTVLFVVPFALLVGPSTYFADPASDSYVTWYVQTEPWQLTEQLVWLVYAVAFLASSKQATLGMQAFDLRVVHEDDLAQIGYGRALGRELLTYLSAAILLIGYLMIAFTQKRQALHDKIARTVVVHDAKR